MRFPEVEPFLSEHGEPSLRWGVLAPGGIARSFVSGVGKHTQQRVVAAGSRSLARAEAFASDFGLERAYGSYEQLVADPEVDAIYVASPHSEHLAHGLLAIAAGKHVLIEKPLAVNADEARTLLRAAKAEGVFAMEAMWSRYLPQAGVLRRMLDDGILGEVQQLFADHGQSLLHVPRLVTKELAGGALLDLGIYPFSFASQALGTPTSVVAAGALLPNEVDVWSSSVLQYGSGAVATISTTMATVTPNTASISGSQARLELAGVFYTPTSMRLTRHSGDTAEWTDPTPVRNSDGLSWQATAMAGYIGEGLLESPVHPHDETIAILATIDEVRAQLPN